MGTSTTDRPRARASYTYAVVAFDAAGNTSAPSNTANASF
jgi:hypothetical protein